MEDGGYWLCFSLVKLLQQLGIKLNHKQLPGNAFPQVCKSKQRSKQKLILLLAKLGKFAWNKKRL